MLNPLQLDGVKGALAENYVASALQVNGYVPYYWESEGKAEIDFIIQHKQGDIIPVDINLFWLFVYLLYEPGCKKNKNN